MPVKIKKGLDIRMKGKAVFNLISAPETELFALKPTDFPGLTPKLAVKPDDRVKVGSPLFYDKYRPEVKFTSPVSGTVTAVIRGERRRILEVVVKSDNKNTAVDFKVGDLSSLSVEDVTKVLLSSGLWPTIRQRPFNIIANPEEKPRAIFISGFDSAPLAPDLDFVLQGLNKVFQKGVDVLSKFTGGKIHIGVKANAPEDSVFKSLNNVEITEFSGPHPAGNVGIQIHHTDPVNKGEVVWVVNPQDVVMIGRLFEKGVLDTEKVIAFVGSEVINPIYYKTKLGGSVKEMTEANTSGTNLRYISGNALTGTAIHREGYIGYYDQQLTVIPEGNYHEAFGWMMPRLNKYSTSMSYFSWMMPKKEFAFDTNLNGGRRNFVMTGQYEKVFPMNIYPVELLKAIIIEDFDLMENLGIYEVAEEDMALCEFVCTSKTEVQAILRKGFDYILKELG